MGIGHKVVGQSYDREGSSRKGEMKSETKEDQGLEKAGGSL